MTTINHRPRAQLRPLILALAGLAAGIALAAAVATWQAEPSSAATSCSYTNGYTVDTKWAGSVMLELRHSQQCRTTWVRVTQTGRSHVGKQAAVWQYGTNNARAGTGVTSRKVTVRASGTSWSAPLPAEFAFREGAKNFRAYVAGVRTDPLAGLCGTKCHDKDPDSVKCFGDRTPLNGSTMDVRASNGCRTVWARNDGPVPAGHIMAIDVQRGCSSTYRSCGPVSTTFAQSESTRWSEMTQIPHGERFRARACRFKTRGSRVTCTEWRNLKMP